MSGDYAVCIIGQPGLLPGMQRKVFMDAPKKGMPGIGNMPPLAGTQMMPARDSATSEDYFFAKEGVDPLAYAFERKIAVHPGLDGGIVEPKEMNRHMLPLLERERGGKSVAYIHVPFCRTHCLYCGFFTQAWRPDESRLYVDALIREMDLWKNSRAMNVGPVHAVYLGGGTPTELKAEDMERLLKAVRERLPLANDCEITVEGRLSDFDERKMEACLAGGANRFSLGVQTFQTDIRQKMGRICDRKSLVAALEKLLSYDQAAVIIDLIYGFPFQTMERWVEDLEIAQSLKLDGADCYQLNVYRHTPLGRAIESGSIQAAADLPAQSRMFAKSVELMSNAFYKRLSMSHWGRTARERNIYNLYVKGSANCLAFGPGAGGNLHGHFYANNSKYEEWLHSVESGQKPYAFMKSPEKKYYFYRAVAESMEQGGLNLNQLQADFGIDVQSCCKRLFSQWNRAGLVDVAPGRLALTLAGQFWQVNLSQLLQEYLKRQLEKSTDEAA